MRQGWTRKSCSSGKNNIANADLDSCVLPTYSSEMDDAEHEEVIEDNLVHVQSWNNQNACTWQSYVFGEKTFTNCELECHCFGPIPYFKTCYIIHDLLCS